MKKVILFLFIIATIISCKKEDARTTPEAEIKVGTVLTYKLKLYTTTGTVFQTYDYVQTILREQVIAGNTWFVTVAVIPGLGADTGYLRKASNGYQILENNIAQLYLKIPAAVNDTWTVTGTNVFNNTVKALNQNVTVPIGTVSCYYVETVDQTNYLNKKWYNETYSLVKLEGYDEITPGNMQLQSSLELVSFTP